MGEPPLRLDVELPDKKIIRVPIEGKEPVKKLLQEVRSRTSCKVTALNVARGEITALLNPEDILWQVLDDHERFWVAVRELRLSCHNGHQY